MFSAPAAFLFALVVTTQANTNPMQTKYGSVYGEGKLYEAGCVKKELPEGITGPNDVLLDFKGKQRTF